MHLNTKFITKLLASLRKNILMQVKKKEFTQVTKRVYGSRDVKSNSQSTLKTNFYFLQVQIQILKLIDVNSKQYLVFKYH